MALSKTRLIVLAATLALAGCSFASDALFPSLGAEGSDGSGTTGSDGPPALGNTDFNPPNVTPGQPTGTFVGQKVQGFRSDLQQLQATIRQRNQNLQAIRTQTAQDSTRYHETVAAMNARLQIGSTPGNPILQSQWEQSQQQLDSINQDIAHMNQLATQVASDSAMVAYLQDSVRASFGLSGAVEEDHRQLRVLEDETNQTMVLIERLLSELSQDISRQQSYVANERSNLNTLAMGVKNGQLYGTSLSNQAMIHSVPTDMGAGQVGGRRPLVVIRFDRQKVAYEQALYSAVSRAIERRPNAAFDVVAVTPSSGNVGQQAVNSSAARRNAEQVVRSLTDMGLPADRVRLSSMSSPSSTANEVHLYVR